MADTNRRTSRRVTLTPSPSVSNEKQSMLNTHLSTKQLNDNANFPLFMECNDEPLSDVQVAMQHTKLLQYKEQMSKIDTLMRQGAKVSICSDGVILRTTQTLCSLESEIDPKRANKNQVQTHPPSFHQWSTDQLPIDKAQGISSEKHIANNIKHGRIEKRGRPRKSPMTTNYVHPRTNKTVDNAILTKTLTQATSSLANVINITKMRQLGGSLVESRPIQEKDRIKANPKIKRGTATQPSAQSNYRLVMDRKTGKVIGTINRDHLDQRNQNHTLESYALKSDLSAIVSKRVREPETKSLSQATKKLKISSTPQQHGAFAAQNLENMVMYNVGREACGECLRKISLVGHFTSYLCCKICRYSTCCSKAISSHVNVFHGQSTITVKYDLGTPIILKSEMFCVCGFKTTSGNKIAKHLAKNGCISAYASEESAKSAQKNCSLDKATVILECLKLVTEIAEQAVKSPKDKTAVVALEPGAPLEAAFDLPLS